MKKYTQPMRLLRDALDGTRVFTCTGTNKIRRQCDRNSNFMKPFYDFTYTDQILLFYPRYDSLLFCQIDLSNVPIIFKTEIRR